MQQPIRKLFSAIALFLAGWLALRYLFPLILPFLLGSALAAGAEPLVRLLGRRLRFPRPLGAALAVSICCILLGILMMLLTSLAIRQLRDLSGILPDLETTARQGLGLLEGWLLKLTAAAPDGVEPLLSRSVSRLFADSTDLLDRITRWLLSLAAGVLHALPDSALGLGTTILSAYMISAKLPALRLLAVSRFPPVWKQRLLPVAKELRTTFLHWLKAQAGLTGITFLLVSAGLLLLRIPYAPVWGVIVALVDAVPLLGTGLILVPWSIISFLQAQQIRAVGLLGICATAMLTRSVLEPKFLGKQLGMDPLVTLAAMYMGYRLWGVGGLLLSPLLAVLALRTAGRAPGDSRKEEG